MIDDSDVCVAAPFFRKEFRVSDSGRLVSAVVCLCELGCSDLYLNGKSANPIRVQRKYPVLSVRRGPGGELDFRFRCKYRRDFPPYPGFPSRRDPAQDAYGWGDVSIVRQAAEALGRRADSERFGELGRRLALVALNKTYGRSGTLCSGPTFRSMEKRGDRLVLTFGLCGAQWKVADKYGYIRGFAVAGADRRFFWAKAELEGDRIVVWSDRVKDPVAVRYAWGNNPDANLFNDAGLPAVPFRTDGWKGVTE